MRIKPRKRLQKDKPKPLVVPEAPNEIWSMDFMADQLADGRSFRTLNILNDLKGESLATDVDFSLLADRASFVRWLWVFLSVMYNLNC